MKKGVEIASIDNKFSDWSTERLWDHFIQQVVGLYYCNIEKDWHTWLEMIHRADVIPGHHTITQADTVVK